MAPGPRTGHCRCSVAWKEPQRTVPLSRVCEVVTADPGEAFAFRTLPERIDPTHKDSTTWAFTLTRHGSGTNVEHSYVITKLPGAPFKTIFGRAIPQHRDMRPQMADTLQSLSAQVSLKE